MVDPDRQRPIILSEPTAVYSYITAEKYLKYIGALLKNIGKLTLHHTCSYLLIKQNVILYM